MLTASEKAFAVDCIKLILQKAESDGVELTSEEVRRIFLESLKLCMEV